MWDNKIPARAHDAACAQWVHLRKKMPWADFVSGPFSSYEQYNFVFVFCSEIILNLN
jgi:hypothetical protein